MKQLLTLAWSNSRYLSIFVISMAASLLFTFSGQLEMFSLGVITKKGPDFFELFAPLDDGVLKPQESVSKKELLDRFQALDTNDNDLVTKEETTHFVKTHKKQGLISKILDWLDETIPIEQDISYLIYFLIFVAFFKAATLFLWRYSSQILSIRISRDLRQSYFEHIQKLPMSFYQEHNIGSLSSRVVTDATMIADGLHSALINYIQTPFSLITTLILCFLISWQLSLTVFIALPLLVGPIVFLARRIKRISKQIQKRQEAFGSVLVEFLSGIQTVKVFAMEEFSLKKYTEQNDQMARLEKKSARYDVSARPILHTIGIFCLVTALIFGLYGLNLALHEVLFYCGLLTTVYEPIKKFGEENGRIQRGIAASERMHEVLDIAPKESVKEAESEITDFSSSITFDSVSFSYGEKEVLSNISFTIKKGQRVAICGPTGAGKSTIALLLPRLYDVEHGQILIDGKNSHTFSKESLRNLIAFVPQRPFLFFDTVHENISFGRPYTREEVVIAAKKAHADEFISQLPEGYDTVLSEAGKSLSGGQQQRIAIARAFIKNAPILVFDEATSALDATSEELIKQALDESRGQITEIIIAHRLSTIEDADRILFIDRGRKIDEGTKDELYDRCEPFRTMWNLLYQKKS